MKTHGKPIHSPIPHPLFFPSSKNPQWSSQGGSKRVDGVHFVFGTISFDLRYLLVATIATGISFTCFCRFFVFKSKGGALRGCNFHGISSLELQVYMTLHGKIEFFCKKYPSVDWFLLISWAILLGYSPSQGADSSSPPGLLYFFKVQGSLPFIVSLLLGGVAKYVYICIYI